MELVWLFLIFVRASLLSAGGLGSLAILRTDLLSAGLVVDAQLVQALTIGRISPGPTGLFVISIGYFAMGIPGALLALAAAMIPPLLVLPIAHVVRPRRAHPRVDGLIRGLVLATTGLTIAISMTLLVTTASGGGSQAWQLLLAAAGAAWGFHGRHHPVIILAIAGAVGLALSGSLR